MAVFGGGVAGLTAAHELAERGFDVTVYERRAWGGKCRSTIVRGSGTRGRRPLPGEHAYRVPFGFYQNLPDTMRRIPWGSNPNGVFDNLVEAPQLSFARRMKRDLVLPMGALDPRPYTPAQMLDLLVGAFLEMQIPPPAAAYFAQRMIVFLSSCDARRSGQWERVSWIDYIAADRYGEDYRKTLGALPEFTQASKSENTSAKYVGTLIELAIYGLLGRGVNGPVIRVLNGPTNDAWIDPWLSELRRLGVRLLLHREVAHLHTARGRITAARIRGPWGQQSVTADWYVCALPVERARALWTAPILAAAPTLAGMYRLEVAWMNGISYYLRRRAEILDGHVLCGDSPWWGSFLTQAQFWSADFATTYGNGTVRDKLSAAIAEWTKPGIVYGKPARDCTPDEIAHDLWEQIKQHVNKPRQPPKLTDDVLHSWQIDPGMLRRGARLISADPLILPAKGSERYRPGVATGIPNLMLCGDYLSRDWIITTMESANHTGRQAANAILAQSGSRETPAATIGPYRPPEWEPFKKVDEQRYRHGQPNQFDTELPVA